MILDFVSFLNENDIPYKFTNGYELIYEQTKSDSDYDILFKKEDFRNIDSLINRFCSEFGYVLVQVYHQCNYGKNFFIVDPKTNVLLNLDLYGELSRKGIKLLNEKDVFSYQKHYKELSILLPEDEFIQYLIKRIDKEDIADANFKTLITLYKKNVNACNNKVQSFFRNTHDIIIIAFKSDNYQELLKELPNLKSDYLSLPKDSSHKWVLDLFRILKRIMKPTGFTICFLGPDGSGKSTIIDGLTKKQLPFRRTDYFHLKPLYPPRNVDRKLVENPHDSPLYSTFISYIKLCYLILQYNLGWLKNIFLLKRKSSLIIFDRYFDDILVDYKRYRFGGNIAIVNLMRYFIPKPELYIILTSDADVIYKRKQEVSFKELNRQIFAYRKLSEKQNYININVNREPEDIVSEVFTLLMYKLNERY